MLLWSTLFAVLFLGAICLEENEFDGFTRAIGKTDDNKKNDIESKIWNIGKWRKKANRAMQKDYGTMIAGVGDGFCTLYTGVKSGDDFAIARGAIDMIAAVVSITFPPYGAIAAGVLSLISAILSLFGPKKPTSAEIFRKVIREETERQFKIEVETVMDEFQTLQKRLQIYRSYITELKNERKQIEKEKFLALAQYHHAVYMDRGDSLKAKFQTQKIRQCRLHSKEDEGVGKCVRLVNLYCNLEIARQTAMIDLSGFLSEVGDNSTGISLKAAIDLLHDRDRSFLRFLVAPFEVGWEMRYVTSAIWSDPSKYETILRYLVTLHKTAVKSGSIFFPQTVTICHGFHLQLFCTLNGNFGLFEERELKYTRTFTSGESFHFPKSAISAFIPLGAELRVIKNSEDLGTFVGPVLKNFNVLPDATFESDNTKVTPRFTKNSGRWSVSMEFSVGDVDWKTKNALNMVRLCQDSPNTKPKLYTIESKYVKVQCFYAKTSDSCTNLEDFPEYHRFSSLLIPDGLVLTAYTGKGCDKRFEVSEFYGPLDVRKDYQLCRQSEWKSVSVRKALNAYDYSFHKITLQYLNPNYPYQRMLAQKVACPSDSDKTSLVYRQVHSDVNEEYGKVQGCPIGRHLENATLPVYTTQVYDGTYFDWKKPAKSWDERKGILRAKELSGFKSFSWIGCCKNMQKGKEIVIENIKKCREKEIRDNSRGDS